MFLVIRNVTSTVHANKPYQPGLTVIRGLWPRCPHTARFSMDR
jgi:hypothetical protein